MNLIRCSETANRRPRLNVTAHLGLLSLIFASAGFCQTAFVSIYVPGTKVVAGAQMQLAGNLTDVVGTPLDPSGLTWSSSNNTLGKVSSVGTVSGLMPGDITVTATDSNSGAFASVLIHIVPGTITMQPSSLELTVGSTAPIMAQALDANGHALAGVVFQYGSGESSVATIGADGTVTAVAEGFTTLAARVAAATSNLGLIATIPIHVLPAPPYRVRKVFSTETAASTTVSAYTTVSAASQSEIGAIAGLANGSQAAVLIENGSQKVLAATGMTLPNAGRMVMRIDGISANSKGDVALHIEYPSQWCSSSIVFFPHGQPEQEIAAGSCYAPLNQRALAENGSFLYRNNDQILKADAVNGPTLLFSIATQPSLKDPIRSVNDFYPSRAGTFILNTYLASGTHQFFYYDGKTLTPVYKDADMVSSLMTTNLGSVAGGSDGTFYATVYGPSYSGLAQMAPGPPKILVKSNDAVPGGKFGWLQNLADAGPGGVLLATDLSLKTYSTWLSLWNGNSLVPLSQMDGYAALVTGAIVPSGSGIATVQLSGETNLSLRGFTAGSDPVLLAPAAQPLSTRVPPSIDWHYASRGGSDTAIVFRGAGDAIVKLSTTPQTLAAVGSPLPDGKLALWIGGAMANESGDVLFSAGYSNGSGIFRYRAGVLETLVDTTMTGAGPNGTTLNWVDSYRGRYLALSNHGDAAVIAAFNNAKRVTLFGSGAPRLIAQQNVNGQTDFFSNLLNIAVDDKGRVMFIGSTPDGHTAAYFWDGNSVQRVIGTGDPGPDGFTVNEISNIAGSGSGFLIVLASGNYSNRELRAYDGVKLTVVQSTDTTLFDGVGVNYYWANECTLAANGDAHCMAATQDNATGVFAHRQNGNDVVVARSRDRMPNGEWMILPLSVSSSSTGSVYFTALMYKGGNEYLALYEATPQ
jgi:hypothetical protein